MWVGLVQSVGGLNRLKSPASHKNKEILQQMTIRLHLHHQLSWVSTLSALTADLDLSVSIIMSQFLTTNHFLSIYTSYWFCFSGVVQLLSHVGIFASRWTAVHQPSLSFTNSWSLFKFMSIESVVLSIPLIFCHPLLLPLIFPSIRVFSSELALQIRWPRYCSFSFSISPFND